MISLYRLTPALIRECVYSGIRLGAYEPMKVLFGATDPAHTPVYKKLASGASSGKCMPGKSGSFGNLIPGKFCHLK